MRLRSLAHHRPDYEYDANSKARAVGNPPAARQQQQQQQPAAGADAGCCNTSAPLEAAGGWAVLANMLQLQPGCQLGVRAAPYTDRLSVWEVRHPPQLNAPALLARPPSVIPAQAAILQLQSGKGGSLQPLMPRLTASPEPAPAAPVPMWAQRQKPLQQQQQQPAYSAAAGSTASSLRHRHLCHLVPAARRRAAAANMHCSSEALQRLPTAARQASGN